MARAGLGGMGTPMAANLVRAGCMAASSGLSADILRAPLETGARESCGQPWGAGLSGTGPFTAAQALLGGGIRG